MFCSKRRPGQRVRPAITVGDDHNDDDYHDEDYNVVENAVDSDDEDYVVRQEDHVDCDITI